MNNSKHVATMVQTDLFTSIMLLMNELNMTNLLPVRYTLINAINGILDDYNTLVKTPLKLSGDNGKYDLV